MILNYFEKCLGFKSVSYNEYFMVPYSLCQAES
jgi:hypothetical protein